MDGVQVRTLDDVVIKQYKNHTQGAELFRREYTAHKRLWWATPKVIAAYGMEFMTERLPSILSIPVEESRQYKEHLYWLVDHIHREGYWHGNIDLQNVVIHPTRGPLLINWEGLTVASGAESYDLFGPKVITDSFDKDSNYGFWFAEGPTYPHTYWKD